MNHATQDGDNTMAAGLNMARKRQSTGRNKPWSEQQLKRHKNRKKRWKRERELDGSTEKGREQAGEFNDG